MKKLALFAFTLLSAWAMTAKTITGPVDYVSPLVGTQSKHALSTGNTYPAIALPWGMNFWVPQTGKMGDGWAYTYDADKIRGFKQTHQPSPWIKETDCHWCVGLCQQLMSTVEEFVQSDEVAE